MLTMRIVYQPADQNCAIQSYCENDVQHGEVRWVYNWRLSGSSTGSPDLMLVEETYL